jgi:hypothetical protein
MTVFRWIMGVLTAVLAGGSVLCFVLFMAFDINVWLDRARSLRRGAYLAALLWFNTEIWGRVVYTIIHW